MLPFGLAFGLNPFPALGSLLYKAIPALNPSILPVYSSCLACLSLATSRFFKSILTPFLSSNLSDAGELNSKALSPSQSPPPAIKTRSVVPLPLLNFQSTNSFLTPSGRASNSDLDIFKSANIV